MLAWGLFGTAMGCLGVGVFAQLIPGVFYAKFWQDPGPAVGGVVVALLFLLMVGVGGFSVAVQCGWRYATNYRAEIRIDRRGITKGERHFGWDELVWVGATRNPFTGGLSLEFVAEHRPAEQLPLDERLNQDAYDRLIQRLKSTVGVDWPHLTLGTYRRWWGRGALWN